MKTTLTVAAIAMFAVILGMGVLSPAMAVKADKIDICHYAEEEIEIDPETGEEIVTPAQWKVININENGWKGHAKHNDGNTEGEPLSDEIIDEDFTVDDCLARNSVTEPEVPETPTA